MLLLWLLFLVILIVTSFFSYIPTSRPNQHVKHLSLVRLFYSGYDCDGGDHSSNVTTTSASGAMREWFVTFAQQNRPTREGGRAVYVEPANFFINFYTELIISAIDVVLATSSWLG